MQIRSVATQQRKGCSKEMLTDSEKRQCATFVVNLVCTIHRHSNATEELAEVMVQFAAAALLLTIFHQVPEETPNEVDRFMVGVIDAALKREYAVKVKVLD